MGTDNSQRLLMYKTLLEQAVEKRKENISAKDLAEKLKIEPTSIYRLERGVNDMKLSTFLAYLDAFNYQIEITPKTDPAEKESSVDLIVNEETPIEIEYAQINPSALDHRQRLRLLKYLIELEEKCLNENE